MSTFEDKPYSGEEAPAIKALPGHARATSIPVLPKRPLVISVTPAVSHKPSPIPTATSPTLGTSPSAYTDHDSTTSPMSSTTSAAGIQSGNGHGDEGNSQLPRPVVLPPRAKPGRKPATDTPASRRKAQNREAQRNFRDRKRQREHELQEQARQRELEHLTFIRKIQEKHEAEMRQLREQKNAAYEGEKEQFQRRLHDEQQRNNELNRQVQKMIQRQISGDQDLQSVAERPRAGKVQKKSPEEPQYSKASSNSKGKKRSPPRPSLTRTHDSNNVSATKVPTTSELVTEESQDEPMEIDFTNMGKPTQDCTLQPFAQLDTSDTSDDSCGFCDANTYCACKDRMVNAPPIAAESPSITLPKTGEAPPTPTSLPKTMEPAAAPIGPGGCRACLDDPERRRICLAMASRRQPAPDATPTPTAILTPTQTPSSAGGQRERESSASTSDAGYPFGTMLPPPRPTDRNYIGCRDAITYGQMNDPKYHERWHRPEFISQLRVVEPREPRDDDGSGEVEGEIAQLGHQYGSPQDVEIASIMAAMSASGDAGAKAAADKAEWDAAGLSRDKHGSFEVTGKEQG